MSRRQNLYLTSRNGSYVAVQQETDTQLYPDYMCWHVAADCSFGSVENSPELRAFLRRALQRLEHDAARRNKDGTVKSRSKQ